MWLSGEAEARRCLIWIVVKFVGSRVISVVSPLSLTLQSLRQFLIHLFIPSSGLELLSTNMSTRPGTPESEPLPQPKTVALHKLCDCCSRIVKKSKIIRRFAADRLEQYIGVNREYDNVEEVFFHNRTLSYIWESSAAGCHLCSMVLSIPSHRKARPFVQQIGHGPVGHSVFSLSVQYSLDWSGKPMPDICVSLNFYKCVVDYATKEQLDDFDHMDSTMQRRWRRFRAPPQLQKSYLGCLQLRSFRSEGSYYITDPLIRT